MSPKVTKIIVDHDIIRMTLLSPSFTKWLHNQCALITSTSWPEFMLERCADAKDSVLWAIEAMNS